jgi:glycosyltransferase involved in cell wall biosynthesis
LQWNASGIWSLAELWAERDKWRMAPPSGWRLPFLRKRKPTRLLLFFHETTWSGAPIQLFHLATWLKRHDWELAVVVPKTDSPQSGPISARLNLLGLDVFPILDWTVAPDLDELRGLCRRFDLVIANTLVMWAGVRAAHDTGIPVIWYIHESLLLHRLLEISPEIRPTLALPDLLVMPTERTAQLYRSLTRRPRIMLPYGIPPVTVKSNRTRDRSRTHFLLLGSYEHRKGQDLLLEAIRQLPPALEERTFFQMIGRRLDREFYETLTRQPMAPNVHLGDELEHDAALTAVAATDVLICASRDETMPIAILEAMSLGKTIITTNVGGTTEWLRDEFNSLLVPAEDSASLAGAIRRCAEKPNLVRSLGRNARRTFVDQFSLDRLGRRFSRLIEQVWREKKA